jgi:phage shock protein A
MGIFGRLWRLIKGWLLIGVEKAEDPEVILKEAQESMQHELAKAKEQAVQALAARNQLRTVLTDQQNAAANLEAKARAALKIGDEELARHLLMEKATYDQNIESLKGQLAQAEAASDAVKANIKKMEAHVRQRAAQRLALVAGWKQAKIQEQLNKSLSGITLDSQNEAFGRAEERIRQLQSQADARLELAETGVTQKIAQLENVVAADQANQALEAMKAEMGLAQPVEEDPLLKLKAQISAEQPAAQAVSASGAEGGTRNIEV